MKKPQVINNLRFFSILEQLNYASASITCKLRLKLGLNTASNVLISFLSEEIRFSVIVVPCAKSLRKLSMRRESYKEVIPGHRDGRRRLLPSMASATSLIRFAARFATVELIRIRFVLFFIRL